MHANYYTDKAHKMKLVYQYYTNGAGIDVLNCGGLRTRLKDHARAGIQGAALINDGIVGSKKWTDAAEGMWAARPDGPPGSKRPSEDPSHCAPPAPWNGAVPGVDRASTLHVVKRGSDGGECGAGVVGDDDEFAAAVAAVCAALATRGPERPGSHPRHRGRRRERGGGVRGSAEGRRDAFGFKRGALVATTLELRARCSRRG